MRCPHCGSDVVHENGPDRFGFQWVSCAVCGWHKWNTTIREEEMRERTMELLRRAELYEEIERMRKVEA